jgi:hypothetical protein
MEAIMNGLQLPLPAGWAREFRNWRDPVEELDDLAKDKLAAKAEIREVLDRLADKHGISHTETNAAVHGYVDDMLSDLTYEVESELTHGIEESQILNERQ